MKEFANEYLGGFKQVDLPTDRKLRYEGFCQKCNKIMGHRYYGGSYNEHTFKCIKCKSHNTTQNK